MNIDKKKLSIQILALLGFILTVKLAHIYYIANYERYALSSFCSINELIDCDGAARSSVSQFIGIPLAYWGMFFYITVFFLTIVDKLKNIKFLNFLNVFKNPMSYIAVLGTIAFICSMILAGLSFFYIKKICILCIVTYLIDFIIAIVAFSANFRTFISSIKNTFIDFIDGVKKYPKTFIILLLLFASFLTYSGLTNNFVPHIKRHKEIIKYRKMEVNPYKINGNTLGNQNADVVIELYSDFICPMCYIHNIMLHKAAKDFSNVQIIHYNVPFDKACNTNISFNMHPGACVMAKAAIAASKQNNYWGMSSFLYEKQPKNLEEIIEIAKELNFDIEKFKIDIESQEVTEQLQKEITQSVDKGIDGTPTIFVNGNKKVGIMPYYEMKELLIKNGAKPRK